ncbi:MAG: AI-2E family transporter, partial [Lachnospiraceae bacterium]|nr:AI-2E family transporter [Lachnospiraceae bacterium]
MNNRENERHFRTWLTGFLIAASAILFYFFILRYDKMTGALRVVTGILRPIVIGAILAYLVLPVAKKLTKLLKGKRGLANVLAIVIAVLVVLAVILLIVPQLISSIVDIVKALPAQIERFEKEFTALLETYSEAQPESADLIGNITKTLSQEIQKFMSGIPDASEEILGTIAPFAMGALSGVGSAFGIAMDIMVGIVVALYILFQREQLAADAKLMIRAIFKPSWATWLENEIRYANKLFNGFLIGKLLDSLIIGLLCFVGSLILRFKSPLLIAVIVGVTNIIPFFGPFIGAVPCTLLILLDSPIKALIFVIFILVLQQLDGNVIGPKILGDSTGLSALWVLFGILLFGGLWGVV